MAENKTAGIEIDTTDRPSMGDAEFVDGRVRAMLTEANDRRMKYHTDGDPNAHILAQHDIEALVEKWVKEFSPSNEAYVQTMDPAAQSAWLRQHGFGSDDDPTDDVAPLRALLCSTITQIFEAEVGLSDGVIDEEACRFRVAVAVEDCVSMLLGIENSADENG